MSATFPLGPHFPDPGERAVLARCLRQARTQLLDSTRPASAARWARGYFARLELSGLLWAAAGERSLHDRIWHCPLWRERIVTGHEAAELATDGALAAKQLIAKIIAEADRAALTQATMERYRRAAGPRPDEVPIREPSPITIIRREAMRALRITKAGRDRVMRYILRDRESDEDADKD